MTIKLVCGAIEIQIRGFQVWFGFPFEIILPGLFAWLEGGVKDL
jgi:hypothetical protein